MAASKITEHLKLNDTELFLTVACKDQSCLVENMGTLLHGKILGLEVWVSY